MKIDAGRQSGWAGHARLAVGLAISAGSLGLLVWNVDWVQFVAAIQRADYWWLLLSLAALLVAVWLKVVRWQLLLLPVGRVSQENLLYGISVGYLMNTVLPGRLGELARVYLVARVERVSPVAVLSSVAVDRILDVVVLALLLAVVLPTAQLPDWVAQSGVVAGAGGVALLVACLVLAYPGGRDQSLRLLALMPNFPGKRMVSGWAEGLCLGAQGLRGVSSQARIAIVSLAIWIVTIFIFYFGQLAFHIQAPLWAAALVTAITSLGMVVPSSPGYVGVFHYLVVVALGAFGVEREVALGFAVVIHLAEIVPLGALGAFSLWRCGLTLVNWREGWEIQRK